MAEVVMDIFDVIEKRHSSRIFRFGKIEREVLEKMVDAARRAPSARNEQTVDFVVITEERILQKIADFTDHGKFIAHAPACVAVLCRYSDYYVENGSAATQNLLLAATALGVHSCWVAGDKKAYAGVIAQFLNAPPGSKLVSLVALGYEDKPGRQAAKRPLADVLHWEKFE